MRLLAAVAAAFVLVLTGCGSSGDPVPTNGEHTPGSGATDGGGTVGPTSPDDVTPSPADATPSPASSPELAVGSWVETVVDGLRLREAPGLEAPQLATLPMGTTGTIIDGPTDADGYQWFHLMWPGRVASGPPCEEAAAACYGDGWVASADPDGTAWLAAATPSCPETPTTVAEVAEIEPGRRLACYSNRELTLTAYLAPETEGRGCAPGYTHEPVWLGPCPIAFLQATETQFEHQGPEISANVHPDIGACDFGARSPGSCPFVPYFGQWIRVTGHHDDPAASSCTASGERPPEPALVAYECRERFVVTAIEPGTAP